MHHAYPKKFQELTKNWFIKKYGYDAWEELVELSKQVFDGDYETQLETLKRLK